MAALREPLQTGWLAQGPRVEAFERVFAERLGVRHAVAVSSCTSALHLILIALGIGPGDEVVVPSFTFVASANAVEYVGARPVLVDVDPATFNLNVAALEPALTPQTRAIMPVHQFGLCADMPAVHRIAEQHGLSVVEDAACGLGASVAGRPAGTFGVAAFSFHARKIITTGEGGMVTTDSDALAAHLRRLRSHGASAGAADRHARGEWQLPGHDELGFNFRMTDLQASVGLVQLDKLEEILVRRRRMAERYRSGLSGLPGIHVPSEPSGYVHAYQSYVLQIDEEAPFSRDELARYLLDRGIATRQGTHAVHGLSYYAEKYGYRPEHLPVAWRADRGSLALPLFPSLELDDLDYVIDAVRALWSSRPGGPAVARSAR